MNACKRTFVGVAVAAAFAVGAAHAQTGGKEIKLGVMSDMSSLY